MFELIRTHQLNVMLLLCGACAILIFLLINTGFLSKSRKRILTFMQLMALFLLWFDRQAYLYAGNTSLKGFVMVRLSNFLVFFLTSAIVFGFNLYLKDLLLTEGKLSVCPNRLHVIDLAAAVGMILVVISVYTNLYYYFDENNLYHRGPGFLIAYAIPVVCPLIQFTVIWQYRKLFSRLIFTSLVLYIFVPLACGILQIFTYGISIVNMAMVAVSVSLYVFMYMDLNYAVQHAYEIEIQNMQGEQKRMRRLFDQIATAFVSAVETKDEYVKGNSLRSAQYAKRIAQLAGKSEEDCEKVYYAALLHDVGLIGIPDNVIKNDVDPQKWDYKEFRRKPVIGAEILSNITEYPYLREGARYSHERYNGTGYPEGLAGEAIPEIARIIAVADAYVTMTTSKRYRDARPDFEVREAFLKGAGEEFDPVFAELMVKIIDSESREKALDGNEKLEKEITCRGYRENTSAGILVTDHVVRISFDCEMPLDGEQPFSAPLIVLFDAHDGRVHDNQRSIDSYHYLEYGEVWFDKYSITTEARKIEEKELGDEEEKTEGGRYEIVAGRYEDHLKLVMRSGSYSKEVIVALSGGSKAAYIGLTGENCRLFNITAEPTGRSVGPEDIPKIVEPISYIDHFESDVHNVQVDRNRSAYSEGIEIMNHKLKIRFHSTTLPGANLVWHCPYVVLYSSDLGQIGEGNYREYALIKLNGENEEATEFASNRFSMKKKEDFDGWEAWKAKNHKGLEYEVTIERKGNRITLRSDNLGISIENVTVIRDAADKVYVALTGDQVALTDVRVDGMMKA